MKLFISISLIICTTGLIAQNPLFVPPSMSGTNFNLMLQDDSIQFYSGVYTHTMGISSPILAPTLMFQQGDLVDITIDNQISDTTTMHWHGMHIPSEVDGGPHTIIPPGTIWNPSFIVMDKASTMWYHPHLHMRTNRHVQMGMSGMLIIQDSIEAALNLPRTYGVDDIPLILQTKSLDSALQIDTDMMESVHDTLVLANATKNAYFDAPAQIVRFRLLNAGSERAYHIGLSDNSDFNVIGSDGGLLEAPVPINRLIISPGERYEILLDLNGMTGDSVDIMNYGTTMPGGIYGTDSANIGMMGAFIPMYSTNPLNGGDFRLLRVYVGSQTASPITTIPSSLVTVTQYDVADVDVNRTITMSPQVAGPTTTLTGPFQLNGAPFDMSYINDTVLLGDTEIWTLVNQTQISHPFHIHDIQFNILEIGGATPPVHMQGWKDILLVPPMGATAKFIARFDDHANPEVPYMYHCHILTHEDNGMMAQFIVVDTLTSVSEFIESNIRAYPNPSSDIITIDVDGHQVNELKIYSIAGSLQMRKKLYGDRLKIDVSTLEEGLYVIEVGQSSLKFIKQ